METVIKFRKSIMLVLKTLSVSALILSFIGVWHSYYSTATLGAWGDYIVIVSYLAIFVTLVNLYGGFLIGINRLHEIIYSQALSIIFTNFIMYLEVSLILRDLLPIPQFLYGILIQIGIMALCAFCLNTVYFKLYAARKMAAVFDDAESGMDLIKKMSKMPERFKIERGISANALSIDEIKNIIDGFDAIMVSDLKADVKYEIMRYCYTKGKRIYVLPSSTDVVLSSSYHIQISDTPVLMCKNRGITTEQAIIKRVFDIVFALIGIILASPIMLALSIAIKVCDGGPVLFKQNRVTKGGKIFNVYKFRSMVPDADKDGAVKARDNDDRITAVGRFMRPVRLDELPQLFNILFGSMSFVGPRPERIENVYEYTTKFPDFDLRHRVKGGLTGYAQIYGKYNTSPEDKLKMDLIYIERYSLLLDLKLLAMTVKILFMKESTEGFSEKASTSAQIHTGTEEEEK